MDTTLQTVIMWSALVVLVACSAFFSSSETAISCINRIRLKHLAANGNKQAERVLKLSDRYSHVITGILIGNNIVNIAASTLSTVIFTHQFGAAGAGISTVTLTIVILVFGEVTPKSLAKDHADSISQKFSAALSVIIWILNPIIFCFDKLKAFISHFAKKPNRPSVTEQELKVIIEEVEDEGVLEGNEGKLVRSALDLDETSVGQTMTPRVDLISIEASADIEQVKQIFLKERFSRLPVYQKDIDNIIGILGEKDFFYAYLSDESFTIASLLRKPLFVPPQLNISDLLKEFQEHHCHMAIVIDQYGGVEGIITLEDIFERLVGDIYDESDDELLNVESIDQTTWRINPDISVEEMLEEIEYHPQALQTNSHTVGGWVLEQMEKLPKPSDYFCFERLKITVAEMDGNRMLWLTVELLPEQTHHPTPLKSE